MTLRKQVKYNAKRYLCNNWGKAISIVLLNTAVYLLFAIIEMMIAQLLELPIGDSTILMSVSGAHTLSFILSLLMSIGSFLLMVPLNLGIMRWYHSLSDGVSEDIMGIFSCFANRKMFFRSLWLSLNTGVRIALTAVLYLFLPTVGFVLSSFLLSSHLSEALFLGSLSLVFSAVLFLLMGGFFLMRIQRYFLAKYYLLDGETTVRQAIRSSVHATRGICDEILVFKFSFLLWALSSLLVLPVLYFSAYYSMSTMLYARFLMEQDKRSNSIVPVAADENTREVSFEQLHQSMPPEDLAQTQTFVHPSEEEQPND